MYPDGIKPKAPAPAPSSATRTSADQLERTATPPRARSGPAAQPSLQSAASKTDAKVEAAQTAQSQVRQLESQPRAPRAEVEQARTDAAAATLEAKRAVTEEVVLARALLSPSYADLYTADLAREHADDAQTATLVQAGIDQVDGAAATALPPDPVQASLDRANRAQADYDRLLARGAPSDSYATHVLEPARARVDARWGEVETAIEQELQAVADAPAPAISGVPRATVEGRIGQLRALAPNNENYLAALDNAAASQEGKAIAAQVESTYQSKGALAAAKVLDELTADRPPAVAREALLASQPTLDAIGADLGEDAAAADYARPPRAPASYEHPRAAYDETVLHLSNVAYNAGTAQGGAQAVDVAANAIASHVDPDNVGRLDESLGLAVRSTGAATLAVGVADRLQRDINAGSGRKSNQADDILQNVEDGLGKLREDAQAASEELFKDDVFRLISGYTSFVAPGADPQAALEAHLRAHPDGATAYREKLAKIDDLGAAAIRAEQSLPTTSSGLQLPASLRGLDHADKLGEQKAEFDADPTSGFVIASSTGAAQELDRIVAAAGDDPVPLIDNLTAGATVAKSTYEAIGNIYVRRTVQTAAERVRAGDIAGATQALDGLKNKGAIFGVDNVAFNQAVDALKTNVATGAAATDPDVLTGAATRLDEKLRDAGFDNDTVLGRTFRVAGVVLSTVGFAGNVKDAFTDGTTPSEVLTATAAGAGLGRDVTELLESKADFINSAGWKAFGASLAVVGIGLDLWALHGQLGQGQYADAGLTGLGLAGGGLGLWATLSGGAALGGWAGPIGIGLVALGAAGKFGLDQWRQRDFANALENGATEDYLVALGFNKDVARELRNAGGDGRSPLPVLAGLAKAYGYDLTKDADVQAFMNYLNSFSGDEDRLNLLEQVVEQAHEIERNDNGELKVEMTEDERYVTETLGWAASVAGPSIESIEGLRWWIEGVSDLVEAPWLVPADRTPNDGVNTR